MSQLARDADSERLLELLVEWEQQRCQGRILTPQDLCPDDPVLQEALAQRIRKRQRLHALLGEPTATESTAGPAPSSAPHIPGYSLEEVLGQGATSIVYKARDLALNRTVALKMILSGPSAGPAERARFRTEAEAIARLQHPGIAQIHEIGEHEGRLYLALEYVAGGSLAQHLDGTPLPPQTAARLLLSLARAVQHAHEQGIIHRDLKPGNILLQLPKSKTQLPNPQAQTPGPDRAWKLGFENWELKVTDFGLAKRLDRDGGQTQTGAVLGTPTYMAPEQAAGRIHAIGPATDVWALGAILYELLTGRPPFQGSTILETLELVRTHDPAAPRSVQPEVPRDLETICLKCLEKEPDHRYRSAAELAADLEAFLAGDPIKARSLTLLDHLSRTLAHNVLDERWLSFANRARLIAPLPALVMAVLYLLFFGHPQFPMIAAWTMLGTLVGAISLMMLAHGQAIQAIPGRERRQVQSLWIGNIVACILVMLTVLLRIDSDPEAWFLVFPLWAILAGQAYLSMGANVGRLYVTGTVCFLLSVLMLLTPRWAALECGLFMSFNLAYQSTMMHRLVRAARAP
jgi:serine/threonine protein kinase